MSSRHVRPLLSAYLDGEVTPAERAHVESHLAACTECSQVLAEYRTLGTHIRELSRPLPPTTLHPAVWAAIERQERQNTWGPGLAGLLRYGAIAAVLVLAVVVVLSNIHPPQQQAAATLLYPKPNQTAVPRNVSVEIGFGTAVNTRQDAQKVVVLSPADDFKASWDSDQRLTLTPNGRDGWQAQTAYTITVLTSLQFADNSRLVTPLTWHFTTGVDIASPTPTPSNTPAPTASDTPVPSATPVPPAPTERVPLPSVTPAPTEPGPPPTAIAQNTLVVPPAPPTITALPTHAGAPPPTPPAATPTHVVAPPTVPPTSTVARPPTGTPPPSPPPPPGEPTAGPSPTPAPTASPVAPSPTRGVPSRTPSPVPAATDTRVPATATATPAAGTPTVAPTTPAPTGGTPTVEPTTPTPVPPTPEATSGPQDPPPTALPTLAATAEPTVAPAPAPSATATPPIACLIPPQGNFGQVYRAHYSVRNVLGCPAGPAATLDKAVTESFQTGFMFWNGDGKQVYVFNSNAMSWAVYADTWLDGDPNGTATPPAGLYAPVRGFGKVWREQADVQQGLGWALAPESAVQAELQSFAHGLMVRWDSTVRVLYQSHAWEAFTAP